MQSILTYEEIENMSPDDVWIPITKPICGDCIMGDHVLCDGTLKVPKHVLKALEIVAPKCKCSCK